MPDTAIPLDKNGRPCETCKARVAPDGGGIYGPPHIASNPGHANHCSCDGCY